ncbi:L-type lectin-domain containing receptor kinase IX.1-like [Lolium perenne]|uniref:L-type lectin-domain containing receptor kinase IX.1-like n=1 Tax=Lolium perenne TaxID=4522 RepID=UPI0021F5E7D1|nr:L-type lectin-domain containing receptor kinase IX.2-like [Lolium perenne]
MAIQLKLLVPCLCIILLPSIIFFSHAKEGSCPGSEQERSNYIMKDSDGVLLVGEDSGLVQMPLDKLPDANANSTRVLSTINPMVELCRRRPDGLGVDESSFNVTIFMRNQTTPEGNSIFSLLILHDDALDFQQVNDSLPLAKQLLSVSSIGYALNLSNLTYRSGSVSDRDVYAAIGMLQANSVGVDIIIYPAASNYSVWIDYHRDGRLSVYVDVDGKPKPASAVAEAQFEIGSVVSPTSPFVHFGLLSTLEQRLRGVHFSATVDSLPDYPVKGGFLTKRVTLLSSILGSVATAAMVAVSVMCYFNSRYRRWHKELNQLAKSMERLPGMPTKVEFADINKATSNFHDSMKLGGGGFGTVYRCTLPAAASKTEWPMDVAVKRFTREVQNRRYGDFLAEVSIINRLRHKNIVPLVGWSYNKGEPLLIFEYMTNGSLDQHLFPDGSRNGGSSNGRRRTGAAIRRWATRYEIVRDIAIGLHYVHHEYEPMVLHRDIKASNVMLDSSFRARLGDFGLACTVAVNRNSATGVAGTWGYIAPEYAICGKATRQTDIYALGVLILELVTGKRALDDDHVVNSDDMHITDWVWRLHREGRLSECVDAAVLAAASEDEEEQMGAGEDAARLLLLGLACSNPNPSDRPTMPDVVQVIVKSVPPPEVPRQKPSFVWPPPGGWASDDDSTCSSMMSDVDRSRDEQQVSLGQPMQQGRTTGRYASFQIQGAQERVTGRHASFQLQHSV